MAGGIAARSKIEAGAGSRPARVWARLFRGGVAFCRSARGQIGPGLRGQRGAGDLSTILTGEYPRHWCPDAGLLCTGEHRTHKMRYNELTGNDELL